MARPRHLLLTLVLSWGCLPPPTPPAPGSFLYELDRAREAHQPLVVVLGATWCNPCKALEHLLDDPRVQPELVGLHLVRLDVDTPAGKDARERCQGDVIPTVAAIDARGYMRLKKVGTDGDDEHTVDALIAFFRQVHEHLGK